MLKVATGATWPTEGEVWALGSRYGTVDIREMRRRIGWVSSALEEWIVPQETALEVVESGRAAAFRLYEEPTEEDRDRALEVLELLGLGSIVLRAYGKLSQGEKQRVLIARSLVTDAEILILDEAAAGLDLSAREMLLDTVERVAGGAGGATIIFVTHHIEEIMPSITHALVLSGGRVLAAGAKEDVLTGEILSRAFGMTIEVDRRHGRYWVRVAVGRDAGARG